MRRVGSALLLCAGLVLTAPSVPVQAAGNEGPALQGTGEPGLVSALQANGARVLELGRQGGLDGYFVEVGDGDAYGLYLTPDGHAVAGLLYAPDGTMLTGGQIAAARNLAGGGAGVVGSASASAGDDKLVAPARRAARPATEPDRLVHMNADDMDMANAQAPYRSVSLFEHSLSAFGFAIGWSGPRVVVFADPACRWSRSAVARLGHVALDGRTRLRVVPVGVLGAASAREAAAIASAPDPALAWFEGAHGRVRPEGGRRIADNNALFEAWGAPRRAADRLAGARGTRRAQARRHRRYRRLARGAAPMSERARAIRQAVNRFAFHRDQHHGWRRAAGWLLLCNALTLAALGGTLALYAPVYVTVAATPDGRLVPLTPLDEPIMSDAALRNWTVAAVTEAFTLGHHDWRLRLSSVRGNFTDEGYESFLASLNESLFLDRLRDNLQVASAVAQGAPVVTDTRYFEGRLGWAIEFPLLVTFAAGARSVSQDLVARVLVMRVPLSERPAGIGIEQLLAEKRRPSL